MDIHKISPPEFAPLRDAWLTGTPPKCPVCGEGVADSYVKNDTLNVWMMTFMPCGHAVQADPNE